MFVVRGIYNFISVLSCYHGNVCSEDKNQSVFVSLILPDKVLSILFLLQLRIDLLLTSLMMREALWWSLTKLFDEGAEGVTQYD